MPYTSYTTYNYSNYGRPYGGSKTYSSFEPSTTSGSYSTSSPYSQSTTSSYIPSIVSSSSNSKASSSNNSTLKNSYGLKTSTSSAPLLNYDAPEKKRVSAVPCFLSGNTASLRKAFGASTEPTSASSPTSPTSSNSFSSSSGSTNAVSKAAGARSSSSSSAFSPVSYKTSGAGVGVRRQYATDAADKKTTPADRSYYAGLSGSRFSGKTYGCNKEDTDTSPGSSLSATTYTANASAANPNYFGRSGIFDPPKLKEIDSTRINLSAKPPVGTRAFGCGAEKNTDGSSSDTDKIYRNRQVVRLTIKRNKEENENEPYEVRKNSIKTVAQKLLDKYTISDVKKPKNESLSYGPRDRYISSYNDSERNNKLNNSDEIGTHTEENNNKNNNVYDTKSNFGTKDSRDIDKVISNEDNNESNTCDKETDFWSNIHSGSYKSNKRKLSKPGAELEDGVVVFSRATEDALHKKDLESAEEVKDIIVAAALHPDIDIESDEEIKLLIEADNSTEDTLVSTASCLVSNTAAANISGATTDEIKTIGQTELSGRKINPVGSIVNNTSAGKKKKRSDAGKSSPSQIVDSNVQDGTIIVDKIKRFVKRQVSSKRASAKKPGDEDPVILNSIINGTSEGDTNDLPLKDTNSVGKKSFKENIVQQNEIRKEQRKSSSGSRRKKSRKLLKGEKGGNKFLSPADNLREDERNFKKSPTPQLALREGMEKIKISIAQCDNICKKSDDNLTSDSNDSGSLRNSITSCSENGANLCKRLSNTETCLKDAPWRKKYINKSKTSANLFASMNDEDQKYLFNPLILKSPSAFALDPNSIDKSYTINDGSISFNEKSWDKFGVKINPTEYLNGDAKENEESFKSSITSKEEDVKNCSSTCNPSPSCQGLKLDTNRTIQSDNSPHAIKKKQSSTVKETAGVDQNKNRNNERIRENEENKEHRTEKSKEGGDFRRCKEKKIGEKEGPVKMGQKNKKSSESNSTVVESDVCYTSQNKKDASPTTSSDAAHRPPLDQDTAGLSSPTTHNKKFEALIRLPSDGDGDSVGGSGRGRKGDREADVQSSASRAAAKKTMGRDGVSKVDENRERVSGGRGGKDIEGSNPASSRTTDRATNEDREDPSSSARGGGGVADSVEGGRFKRRTDGDDQTKIDRMKDHSHHEDRRPALRNDGKVVKSKGDDEERSEITSHKPELTKKEFCVDKLLPNKGDKKDEFKSNNVLASSKVMPPENAACAKLDEKSCSSHTEKNGNYKTEPSDVVTNVSNSSEIDGLNCATKTTADEKTKSLGLKTRGISNKLLEEKKAGKQYGVGPAKEKAGAAEILNARNILKRPVIEKGAKESNKPDLSSGGGGIGTKLLETNLKKQPAWKKSASSNENSALTGADEIRQLRNVLKKPGPTTNKQNAIPTSKGTANNTLTDATSGQCNEKKDEVCTFTATKDAPPKVKKLWKKKPSVGSKEQQSLQHNGESSDEENDHSVTNKRPGVQHNMFKLKNNTAPQKNAADSSGCETSSKKSSASKDPTTTATPSFKNGAGSTSEEVAAVSKATQESNNLIGLCASKSADSAYGSSPSTPLTTGGEGGGKLAVGDQSVGASREKQTQEQLVKKLDSEVTCMEKNLKEVEESHVCGTNCHKKCEKQIPNLCGVNQKLLAEALSSVKRDSKDVSRLQGPSTSFQSTSSSSGGTGTCTTTATTSDDETDDTTTSTTDSEFNGPAEIRAPLQSRPKFRKYTVDDFHFIKVLGKGSFGKVMLAQQLGSENYFAVKCLKKDVVLEDNDVECTLIERKVLTLGTKHPYLCHLFCTFQTQSHLFFVMEYLTGGDLMFHIQHSGRFDEYRACFYSAEICSGLRFLHSKGIIYRDLKLDNILLDYEGHIRIADFGMCKLQIYLDKFADTFCGTPDYMAPEVIKGQHYNQCVDWWSFGVLLYEMMVGKSPFKGCDEDHLFWLICNEEPFYPRFLTVQATSILKQLLDKDSNKRLGIPYSPYGDIQSHPFYKYVDWSKIERKEVETPYKPRLRHILDVQFFDPLFTRRNAALTPIDDSILATMDQVPFKDFSYTNPNITD